MKEFWPEIQFETCDERFTSEMAQQIVKHAPQGKKRKKGLTDRIAAQLILQDYLERQPSRRGDLNQQ
jgi:RNase H-fold protein (predicted Holliday junction resolvase)